MSATTPRSPSASVAIIGGGLAGLAAAAAAVEGGLRVELFEARRQLGGRAGSFRDPQSGELVDLCQHIGMGCCTNLLDFCQRTQVADCFSRHSRYHFLGPDGRPCDFAAVNWLPAPLHLLPALMRLNFLSVRERLHLLRTLARLTRGPSDKLAGEQTVGPWLRSQGESERAIERFWSVVLQSALSETVDRASLAAARKVFGDGFLASRRAHELLLPAIPLSEIFDRRVGDWLAERGVAIHRGTRIREVEGDAHGVRGIVLADGATRRFDFYIVAVPWRTVQSLLALPLRDALPALGGTSRIRPAAITAVHLWFDRLITALPHAVLVGRLSQWLFHRDLQGRAGQGREKSEVHYQVVISASHTLTGVSRARIVDQVCRELAEVLPPARDAQLVRWRVIAQPAAVFSVRPDLEPLRPKQQTPVANLMLAGDWTATGWPGTMESAVRSGYMAAEAVIAAVPYP